jgi:metal-responsive CopG/Arc/MetJ family transcriptional regulator
VSVAKVAVSLEKELLARVDAAAAAAGQSRSAFVRESLEGTLRTREEEHAVREARAIYGEIEADESLQRLHNAFSSAAGETLPHFGVEQAESARSSQNLRRAKRK